MEEAAASAALINRADRSYPVFRNFGYLLNLCPALAFAVEQAYLSLFAGQQSRGLENGIVKGKNRIEVFV